MVKGPPMRPMCDVSESYNHRLSYLICKLLSEMTTDIPTQCDSSEDLKAAVGEINNSDICTEETIVGSLDVKALYPSLDIPFTINVVCEEFQRSTYNVAGVDFEEVGLYIAINKNEEYIRNVGLKEFCPTDRNDRRCQPC